MKWRKRAQFKESKKGTNLDSTWTTQKNLRRKSTKIKIVNHFSQFPFTSLFLIDIIIVYNFRCSARPINYFPSYFTQPQIYHPICSRDSFKWISYGKLDNNEKMTANTTNLRRKLQLIPSPVSITTPVIRPLPMRDSSAWEARKNAGTLKFSKNIWVVFSRFGFGFRGSSDIIIECSSAATRSSESKICWQILVWEISLF